MKATWGGLNPALTVWRENILRRFKKRGSASDGGVADAAHSATSQHQRDTDGTVDAFDCDVNWLGSSDPDGNALEDRISEAVKLDFENDPHGRGNLWIHNREIANHAIGDWRERDYTGPSPHTAHIHFETIQARERDTRPWPMPRTDALLEEIEMPTLAEITTVIKQSEARIINAIPTADENAKEVWSEPVTLPDGRTVTYGTIARWLPAAESDTRAKILEAFAAAHPAPPSTGVDA